MTSVPRIEWKQVISGIYPPEEVKIQKLSPALIQAIKLGQTWTHGLLLAHLLQNLEEFNLQHEFKRKRRDFERHFAQMLDEGLVSTRLRSLSWNTSQKIYMTSLISVFSFHSIKRVCIWGQIGSSPYTTPQYGTSDVEELELRESKVMEVDLITLLQLPRALKKFRFSSPRDRDSLPLQGLRRALDSVSRKVKFLEVMWNGHQGPYLTSGHWSFNGFGSLKVLYINYRLVYGPRPKLAPCIADSLPRTLEVLAMSVLPYSGWNDNFVPDTWGRLLHPKCEGGPQFGRSRVLVEKEVFYGGLYEVVIEVLEHLHTMFIEDNRYEMRTTSVDILKVSLCSKRFRRIAIPLLYHTINFTWLRRLARFFETISESPNYAPLVKVCTYAPYGLDGNANCQIKISEEAEVRKLVPELIKSIEEGLTWTTGLLLLCLLQDLEEFNIKWGYNPKSIGTHLSRMLDNSMTRVSVHSHINSHSNVASHYGASSVEELELRNTSLREEGISELLKLPRALKIFIYSDESAQISRHPIIPQHSGPSKLPVSPNRCPSHSSLAASTGPEIPDLPEPPPGDRPSYPLRPFTSSDGTRKHS
ncbi:16144_t:CDS:2, partial [Acaulospora colombiana]